VKTVNLQALDSSGFYLIPEERVKDPLDSTGLCAIRSGDLAGDTVSLILL
jgi:hypothetical protein